MQVLVSFQICINFKKFVEKDFQKFKKNLLPHVGMLRLKVKKNKKVKKKDRVEPSEKSLGSKVEKSIKVKQKKPINECNIVVINKIYSEKYNKFIYYWWVVQHIATPHLTTKWTKRMGSWR